ncbi:uncharacterized protein LOC131673715 [Phymastichus coffea]|uniref:uncharacterized protein LOC131673715 n=1 Tax=Phymastichus coffea TaxID=108790 RepID=UPI00273AE63F|nr:uncharacterized protein LOC131673715 [Phymastichus coffea]
MKRCYLAAMGSPNSFVFPNRISLLVLALIMSSIIVINSEKLSKSEERRSERETKVNRTRILMIERIFHSAFRKCHLPDSNELVLLKNWREQRKQCVLRDLRESELWTNEDYLGENKNEEEISKSPRADEKLNSTGDPIIGAKKTFNYGCDSLIF